MSERIENYEENFWSIEILILSIIFVLVEKKNWELDLE